jgi:hypothetical protein
MSSFEEYISKRQIILDGVKEKVAGKVEQKETVIRVFT